MIHPLSIATVQHLYKKLDEGIDEIECDVLLKGKASMYHWQRITYHTIYDEAHMPSIAVGIGEDITQPKLEKLRINQEQMDLVMQNEPSYPISFRCNLTKNKIELVTSKSVDTKNLKTYDDLLFVQKDYVAGVDDIVRFQSILNKDKLIQDYLHGKNILSCAYRRKDTSGSISWVEAMGYLSLDANGQDITMMGVLQNIEEVKKIEAGVPRNIEVNTWGIYKETSFMDMVHAAHVDVAQPCALLLFQVTTPFVDEVQRKQGIGECITYMKLSFQYPCILGEIGSTYIGVFLYTQVDEKSIHAALSKCMSLLHTSPFQNTVDCGGVIDRDVSFSQLYANALQILQKHQETKHTTYRIKVENLLKKKEVLMNNDRNVAIEWSLPEFITRIQKASSTKLAIQMILQELLMYYQAEQAFVYDLQQENMVFQDVLDEQAEMQKDGASLLAVDQLFTHMKDTSLPIYVQDEFIDKEALDKNQHTYILFSLKEDNKQIGILGVYCPRQNVSRLNFVRIISSVLLSVLLKRYIYHKLDQIQHIDMVTQVYNGNRLRQYILDLQENSLHSLGVVYLDINGLKDVNRLYGNHYGDEILVEVAKLLQQFSPYSQIFRYAGDEFMIITENISFEVFLTKCKELRIALMEICDVAMGSAWAQKQISIQSLINNAEEQLSLEKQKYYLEKGSVVHYKYTEAMQQLFDAIKKGCIKMYLQQKVDSANMHVIGAEALVRYEDDEHGLVPPAKFIPFLETTGLIYYVDIFIFEEVNRLLASWKKQGIPLIPISLNFSRITLLENQLVERMNEIQQRYGIDKSLLEIEITESIGEIERQTIIRICAQLEQAGYRLALDDFGTKYSNIAFLSDIHFHTLKFDKGLVDYLIGNKSSRWILESMIALCRKLNIYNVAEGVEQKEQVDILSELGCTYIQGYYYSKPVPYAEFDTSHNYHDE